MTDDAALRESMCGSKHRLTKAFARQQLRKMKASGISGDLKVYKCFFCGWHHVGNKPPPHVLSSLRDRLRQVNREGS